jgi:hypothetical protein
VGGGLIKQLLGIDITKYIYRLVVLIPGIILLPSLLISRRKIYLLLPACYLFFGVASTLWSHSGGIHDSGPAFERALYALSLLVVILHVSDRAEILIRKLFILSILASLPIALDLLHYILFQNGTRLLGFLGTSNPNTAGLIYGVAAVVSAHQILKRNLSYNWPNGLLLFAGILATTAVFLTGSRACLLSLVIALALLCLIQRQGKVLALVALIIGTYGFTTLTIHALKFPESKITAPITAMQKRTYISHRSSLWQEMLNRMDASAFLYGQGLSADRAHDHENAAHTKYIYPHSLFISSFYYLGAIGITLHLAMLLLIAQMSFRDALAGHSFLPCLFGMSMIPTIIDGLSIHPYLAYITPHLLIFWVLYALAASRSMRPLQKVEH